MEVYYSSQPFLHPGLDTIRSCCGVQQGDPLGPLGFALTLHRVVERIKAEILGLTLNAWFLDDGILAGSPGDLAAALHIIERDGPSVELYFNRTKSLLFIPEEADTSLSPLPPDIPISHGGFTLLECPVGRPYYCEVFRRRVAKVVFSGYFAEHWRFSAAIHSPLLMSCPTKGFHDTSYLPPQLHQSFSLLSWRHWGGGVSMPSPPFIPLVKPWTSG